LTTTDKFNGHGTLKYGKGNIYIGGFKDDKRHGQGTYTFPNADKYIGEYKDGNGHGQGTYIYADGRKYVGEFRNGKRHGQGIVIETDGTSFEGHWNEGAFVESSNIAIPVIQLDWEVLPEDWWLDPEYRKNFSSGYMDKFEAKESLERLDFIQSRNPHASYRSKFGGGEIPYYAFEFDECVVAECPMVGNAIYVINDTKIWKRLLQMPKRELRKKHPDKIRKLNHRGNWKERLIEEIGA
jgi:hypothetical protein